MPAGRPAGAASSSELAQLLAALRGDRTQSAAARLAGISQPKLSRAESGRFPLSIADADAYARALGAPPADRRRLLDLTRAHHGGSYAGRRAMTRVGHVIQRRIGDLERETRVLRSWVPDMVPGLLQTRAYTVALIGRDPNEQWWEQRRGRLAVLDDTGRDLHILISETVLRWGIGSRAVMREQLAYLATLVDHPTLRLGVVPIDGIHPIEAARGFHIYGDSTVTVATEVGTTFVTGPDVAIFVEQHAALETQALYRDDAAALIQQAQARFA